MKTKQLAYEIMLGMPTSVPVYVFLHSLSTALSVMLAFCIDFFHPFSPDHWIVIAAFFVSQTTGFTPINKNLGNLILVFAAIATLYISLLLPSSWQLLFIALFFLGVSVALFDLYPQKISRFDTLLFFSFILLLGLSRIMGSASLRLALIDASIGGIIAICCKYTLARVNLFQAFSKGVLPLLEAEHQYAKTFTIGPNGNLRDAILIADKDGIGKAMLAPPGDYPEWAFEIGFNPSLRGGFRYFLLKLDQITEILFSLHGWQLVGSHSALLTEMRAALQDTMAKNLELFAILIVFCRDHKLTTPQSDFTTDITALEKKLRELVPASLELLDISKDYIAMTYLVRELKDLRENLLQLIMTLPTVKS